MQSNTSPSVLTGVVPYSALVGRVIETGRKNIALSQEEMAHRLGLSQSAYSRLEAGQTSMTLSQLRSAAQVLGRESSSLLSEADQYARRLEAQGVAVPNEKQVDKAALLVGLGILLALLSRP